MRFKQITVLLCAVLSLCVFPAAAGQSTAYTAKSSADTVYAAALKTVPSTHKVTVNGTSVSPQAYNIDGYNYYKLRDIAYLLNGTTAEFDVQWDGSQNAINLLSNTSYTAVGGEMSSSAASALHVQASTAKVLLNGSRVSIEGYNINGNNYYKIADTAAALEFSVSFDSAAQTVQIETPAEPEPEEPFTTGVYRVSVNGYLNIRSGPGTDYSSLGQLTNGTEIVVDAISGSWAHILNTDGSADRYCNADYLIRVKDYDPDDDPAPAPDPEPDPEPTRTSNIDGKMTVIVDPGHGGSDIGAHNEDMSLDEKHVNLYVAQYLKEYLEEAGVQVIMVRDTLDEGGNLSLRGQVMEEYADSADLFFSVHHNASSNQTARGAEALAQIADKDGGPSRILAEALLEEYEALGIPIRQVVFREGSNGDYYYTNRKAASLGITALTSEFCFIDNEEDQTFIDSDEDWRAEAEAQARAILTYFEQVDY